MTNPLVLIVDDEADIRELLQITLERMQIDTILVEGVVAAKQALTVHSFDLCLTDMKMPDGNGLTLIEYITEHYPNLPVALITAHGNMTTAVEALKAGAYDCVSKPINLENLRNLVSSAIPSHTASKTPSPELKDNTLIGHSPKIQEIRELITKLAKNQAPVFVTGESGTGKELAARLIHDNSSRAAQPFIAVNCGAIPNELMESEFFGHMKGSFTGAISNKPGLFSAAQGGTLFLDEVADLPLPMQVKLLRTIQEKTIRPIGSTSESIIDVRIISASHKNISKMVRDGDFRQDLFYRLHVIELPMPALREKLEDIPLICEHIISKLQKSNKNPSLSITDNALSKLTQYDFPGNVRELENILERGAALCQHNAITAQDICLPQHNTSANEYDGHIPLEQWLRDIEADIIRQTLKKHNHNKTQTAESLGMSFRSLRYRLEKLKIE